jgi:hypothetical protein
MPVNGERIFWNYEAADCGPRKARLKNQETRIKTQEKYIKKIA